MNFSTASLSETTENDSAINQNSFGYNSKRSQFLANQHKTNTILETLIKHQNRIEETDQSL